MPHRAGPRRSVTYKGEAIPDWAQCYCVNRHRPTYYHVFPYTLPEGSIIYLCPTTYHGLTLYLADCRKDGVPVTVPEGVSVVVNRLTKLILTVEANKMSIERFMKLQAVTQLGQKVDRGQI